MKKNQKSHLTNSACFNRNFFMVETYFFIISFIKWKMIELAKTNIF